MGVLIPVYRQLAADTIWSVRKACVEVLPKVTELSSEDVKN